MTATNPTATSRRRATTAQPNSKFVGKVLKLAARPRLIVGDLVELCGTVLPGNIGKAAIIRCFQPDGMVEILSISGMLDTRDPETGKVSLKDRQICVVSPENLYRLDNSLKPDCWRSLI